MTKLRTIRCPYCPRLARGLIALAAHVAQQHAIEHADRLVAFEQREGVNTVKLPEPEIKENNRRPFLNVASVATKDLKAGGKVKFTGGEPREIASQFGTQFVFPIVYNGKGYDFAISTSSGNYVRLLRKFGTDPTKWKGTVAFTIKEHLGNKYVALIVEP
jgi:hypothetical protein